MVRGVGARVANRTGAPNIDEPVFKPEDGRTGVDVCCRDGVVFAKDKAVPKGVGEYLSGAGGRRGGVDGVWVVYWALDLDVDANLLSSKSL